MSDQWLHMYHHNLSNQSPLLPDDEIISSASASAYGDPHLLSDATVVTTTATSPATASLTPDGRVSKPARRRSRASRRTPTTLLNTDAANFRAMVQQFTGGPSLSNAPNFTFGFAGSRPAVDPSAVVIPPGYHLPPPQQQPQPVFQYQDQTPFSFSLNSPSEAFLQTHGGSRPVAFMGFSDGHPHAPPRPS